MPIERIERYLETSDLGVAPSLGVESRILDDCVNEVRRRGIRGVFGSSSFGFNEDNFDFLKRIPEIEQVWFWDIHLKDIDGLYALEGLKYFGVHERRPPIDFSQFVDLTKMVWHPVAEDGGLEKLSQLSQLDLWRYRPRVKSYQNLRLPRSIEKLEINWSNPPDFLGFPTLPNLYELQIHYCRNLVSLEGLGDFAPNLKKLIITRCPNLVSYQSASELDLSHCLIRVKDKILSF
jgi:hypothetical protein